jgi:hypothetical protein
VATLREQIAADADVFFNEDEFAQTVRHYKAGNTSDHEDVTGVVDEDDEPRDAQGTGDAMQLNTQQGSLIKRFGRLELSISVVVTESGPSLTPSRFLLEDGTTWTAIRILGRDEVMQTVLISTIDRRATRKFKQP